jgi:hypothetical protein
MNLDLTYNTDFAKVEVDDQKVNLDRFNLFFPEKRPFFLENAGLFTIGSPGEVDLFFTRRIGIGANGQQVPIIGGARLSGRVNNTNIGFLNMYTDEVEGGGIQENAYTVARVSQQFGKRSTLGGAFISRSGLGGLMDDHNSTFALDGNLGIGEKARVSGFFAKTNTPGISEGNHSFNINTRYQWAGWRITAAYTEVGEGFNPEVGFLQRSSFRKMEGLVFKTIRAKGNGAYLEHRPHILYRGYWDISGFHQTGYLHIDNHWVWRSGTEVHTGVNLTKEGVITPFEISQDIIVPAGTYDHAEAQIVFFTNKNKPIAVSTRHNLGGFFGGKRYANTAALFLRFGDKFSSEWSLSRNDIRLPGFYNENGDGAFDTNIFKSRIAYAFSPSVYLQSLVQYNSVIDAWSANIRFGWIRQANSGLFIVYNEGREMGSLENRSFIVKYSHVFDLIK